ncbi:MAG TPA: vWA domain-containing protein [Anaerolineae bacterium]|nr:vWA domain-containing protein [Anaerolineae bacterium]
MKWKKRINPFARPEAPPELGPGHANDLEVRREPIGPSSERGIDLVFVIDTTGSMSDKIESLLATCSRFADDFNALHLNQRIAIVSFGDLRVEGDKIQNTAFTSSVEVTKKSLQNIPRNNGGGNEGESSLEALERALSLPFRSGAVKAIVLITDEPADQHHLHAEEMMGRLTEREMLVFVASPPYKYFQRMALRNGGQWYRISAHTNFNDLLKIFRDLAQKVSQVASDVYRISDGSVADYLRLKPPDK